MNKLAIVALAVLAATASAKCPNSCSGHGTCNRADVCTCYTEKTEQYQLDSFMSAGGSTVARDDNLHAAWTGADCSLRTCPRGMSWNVLAEFHSCKETDCASTASTENTCLGNSGNVDALCTPHSASSAVCTANNDANAAACTFVEGTRYPVGAAITPSGSTDASTYSGNTMHKDNMECSDAGLCDRNTGSCQCFDGYEGSACQRTTCPNDCSGHGSCFPNTQFATEASLRYSGAWDSGLHFGCQCDAGFRGADCSLVECPSFTDPMYDSLNVNGAAYSESGNTVGRDCSGRGLCDYSTGLCQCFSGYTGADCHTVLALE